MGHRRAHAGVPLRRRCCARVAACRRACRHLRAVQRRHRHGDPHLATSPKLISRLAGFEGETVWDTSRPDGQPKRSLDVTRAREWIGFEATVELEEGLGQTIRSLRDSRHVGSAVE